MKAQRQVGGAVHQWVSTHPLRALFSLALGLRLVLDLVFFRQYGWHASNLIEIWYYHGVARGVHDLSPLDPTFLLLRTLGWLVPGPALYQAVALLACVLGALSAVLVYLWIERLVDRDTAWWAGLSMALMPAPLTLALANFTHDLVALPLILASFVAFEAARDAVGKRRLLPVSVYAAIVFVGLAIGPMMGAAVIAVLLYVAARRLERAVGVGRTRGAAAAVALIVILTVGLHRVLDANLFDWMTAFARQFRGIDLSAQVSIRVGDLEPLRTRALWNRYTLFLVFVPWGLWIGWRRRELLPLSLVLVGFALGTVVSRGARLMDVGVAALVGLAWSEWRRPAVRVTLAFAAVLVALDLGLRPLAERLYLLLPIDGLRRWPAVLAQIGERGPVEALGKPLIGVALLSALVAAGAGWALWLGSRRRFAGVVVAVTAFLAGAWVLLFASPSSYEIEYQAYRWLDGHSEPGDRIFAAWNQGYFIQAVTGLDPLTTPERVELDLTRIYWMREADACAELAARGVRYVQVNSRHFAVVSVDPERDTFRMRGSTVIGPRPAHLRRFSDLRETFLYRLMYEPASLTCVRTIDERFDVERQVGVRIFELAAAAR